MTAWQIYNEKGQKTQKDIWVIEYLVAASSQNRPTATKAKIRWVNSIDWNIWGGKVQLRTRVSNHQPVLQKGHIVNTLRLGGQRNFWGSGMVSDSTILAF